MRQSFLDKVAASPNVPKYAVGSLAQSIVTAAGRTIYSPNELLNVRNYIQDRGYKMDMVTIADDIGGLAAVVNKSFRFAAKSVCDQLDRMDWGDSLRGAVLEIIDDITEAA